uniref:Uncharacterized protein n=1 Tax=Mycena chlorophos TaxID=658473 RepID=A0ABQ0LA55_MYCCL|nr:predicted protein [Mycena chlorophos]
MSAASNPAVSQTQTPAQIPLPRRRWNVQPHQRIVRIYRVDSDKGRPTIVSLRRSAARDPEDGTLGLNEDSFAGFWEDHGIGCAQCAADERATLEMDDYSFTIITACPHRRQDDSFIDESVNNAVGSLLPQPDLFNPVAGAVVVIKHCTIPDLPRTAEQAPIMSMTRSDFPAVDNFVRSWALGYDDLMEFDSLPPNTFSLARATALADH